MGVLALAAACSLSDKPHSCSCLGEIPFLFQVLSHCSLFSHLVHPTPFQLCIRPRFVIASHVKALAIIDPALFCPRL
jgi:hypothetical protein